MPVSTRSVEFSPTSSFTACVHEVALGNTDMCWGNFWPTATRRHMTTFSGSIYEDEFNVIVRASADAQRSFLTALAQPFTPFTPELWLLILVVFGFVGIMLAYENHGAQQDVMLAYESHGAQQDARGRSSAQPSTGGSRVVTTPQGWTPRPITLWDFCVHKAPLGMLKGWHAYTIGEIQGIQLHTSGSWLTATAIGFTVFVLSAGYGAVVTTRLIEQSSTEITTLQEGLDQNYRFCGNADLRDLLVGQHRKLTSLFVPVTLGDSLSAMDRGECDAAIIHQDFWRAERLYGRTTHCVSGSSPKVALAETVALLHNAIPMREELVQLVSWAIARRVESGLYDVMVRNALSNYTYDLCGEVANQRLKKSFGVKDLGAPVFALAVIAFFSVTMTRCGKRLDKKAHEIEQSIDEDGDGRVDASELVKAVSGVLRISQPRHSGGAGVSGHARVSIVAPGSKVATVPSMSNSPESETG